MFVVNTVLYALIAHTRITATEEEEERKQEKTFEGDEYVYGIDCSNGFMDIASSPNSLSCRHQIFTEKKDQLIWG